MSVAEEWVPNPLDIPITPRRDLIPEIPPMDRKIPVKTLPSHNLVGWW